MRKTKHHKPLLSDNRAQAMVEYALISFLILLGFMGTSQFVLPMFVDAYQAYYDQFYFMLNLPIP